MGPHLVAQTSPNPNPGEYRFFKVAGVIFLIAAVIFIINSFEKADKTQSGLPQDEAVLGAQTTQGNGEGYYLYTVLEGETLFSISEKFEVGWREIVDLNALSEPYSLSPGQRIILPESNVTKQQEFYENLKNKIYVIENGDTFVGIAQKLNVSVTDLLKANPQLDSPDLLTVGQSLNIP